MTVLHYAAKAGHVDVLKILLEDDDADVNMQVGLWKQQRRAIVFMVYHVMRSKIAELYFMTWLFGVMLCWQDDGGWTPIIWASEHRIVPAVKFLIKHGADPNMKDKVSDTVSHG